MIKQQINSEYFSDNPQSFGGKYQLYNVFGKKESDNALKVMIFIHDLNSISDQKNSPLFMFIKKENFSNPM